VSIADFLLRAQDHQTTATLHRLPTIANGVRVSDLDIRTNQYIAVDTVFDSQYCTYAALDSRVQALHKSKE
jgi:hypothetical protein